MGLIISIIITELDFDGPVAMQSGRFFVLQGFT
jgi:hypothetical protein